MRTAVISDVHSNLEALEAVLADASADRVVVLGDITGYGADPQAVVQRLMAEEAFLLAGNHDLALTGRYDLTWFNAAAAAAVQWTREQVSADILDALEVLEPIAREEDRVLVHGSVRDPAAEYLRDKEAAIASFAAADYVLGFYGHTHVPFAYEEENGIVRGMTCSDGESLDIVAEARYLLNPGSVGQPRDGDPRASYLTFDGSVVRWHRVAYDVATAQRKIRDANLPPVLADRLAAGR